MPSAGTAPLRDFTAVRLYVEADLPGAVTLDGARQNYLRNVMRLREGATLLVFNGRDGEWRARVASLTKRDGVLETVEQTREQAVAPTLTFAFAPLKQARLDYLVEKATEMGAGHILPVLTQHGQVRRINADRLRANIVEACEQCGILTVPTLAEPVALADLLGMQSGPLVVADEALAFTPSDAVAAIAALAPPLTVLVGPEGGFSQAERAQLAERAIRVSLGPRILRADTAAVALLALVEAAHPTR